MPRTRPTTNTDDVRLMRAAAEVAWPYSKMLRAVLVREVAGHQDENGRWFVRRSSLDELRDALGVGELALSAPDRRSA